MKILMFAGVILVYAILGAGSANANISPNATNFIDNRPITELRTTTAPLGFQVFCLKNASQCLPDRHKSVRFSSVLMQALNRVNRQVNRSIRAQNDRNGDIWSLNVRRGDCEDYVLAKRASLITMGVPSGALRIATAKTSWGTPHAVLVVRTNNGDFILDNLNNNVKQWSQISHQLIAMSGANPMRWKTIS